MNVLKEAVVSVCFAAVCIGIIELLTPKNGFSASIRLITGTVLLISLISPFTGGVKLSTRDFAVNQSYNASAAIEKSAAIGAKESICEILRGFGIERAKIVIIMDNRADNCIEIKGADIRLEDGGADTERIAAAIEKKTGISVTVI